MREALGWHYLSGRSGPDVPPIVIIATVSCIGVLAGLVAAVVILLLIGWEVPGGGAANDALLIKNLTFYFGHMLVNITMYFGVALVYEIMHAYTGRPWKTNTLVVLSWNTVLALVMFAYLHHLYMDFAQPRWLQVLGQLSSYLVSVPAAVVTIFSALVLIEPRELLPQRVLDQIAGVARPARPGGAGFAPADLRRLRSSKWRRSLSASNFVAALGMLPGMK